MLKQKREDRVVWRRYIYLTSSFFDVVSDGAKGEREDRIVRCSPPSFSSSCADTNVKWHKIRKMRQSSAVLVVSLVSSSSVVDVIFLYFVFTCLTCHLPPSTSTRLYIKLFFYISFLYLSRVIFFVNKIDDIKINKIRPYLRGSRKWKCIRFACRGFHRV